MIFRKGAIFQPLINKKYNVQPKGLYPKKSLSFKRGSGTKTNLSSILERAVVCRWCTHCFLHALTNVEALCRIMSLLTFCARGWDWRLQTGVINSASFRDERTMVALAEGRWFLYLQDSLFKTSSRNRHRSSAEHTRGPCVCSCLWKIYFFPFVWYVLYGMIYIYC